jgi:hypothetical protein
VSRSRISIGCLLIALVLSSTASAQSTISSTRQLRRTTLRLLGRAPTMAEYDALVALPEDRRAEYLESRIDAALTSPELEARLVEWGMEYLRVSVPRELGEPYYVAPRLVDLVACPAESLHAGRWRFLSEDEAICSDAAARTADVDAWWGARVALVGQASGTATTVRGPSGTELYCGDVFVGGSAYNVQTNREARASGCGCGPSAVYCARTGSPSWGPFPGFETWDGLPQGADTMVRSIMEEPARLLAHVVMNDRSFSDLVTGDYTMANVGLFAMYRAHARMQELGQHPERDAEAWSTQFTSQHEWREVPISSLSPYLLDDRHYRFDPRVDAGAPLGIPAAGVLTMMGSNYTFARERVRASRWLEIFACREFAPPPATAMFTPYRRDPAVEGSCSHCHTAIDPAATFFKRQLHDHATVAWIGAYRIPQLPSYGDIRQHLEAAFSADTVLTPLTEAQLGTNSDARLIDFLTGGTTLLGQTGDGTIGPLGFGRILVESGEFDRCAVRRTYERFGGRELDPGRDAALIRTLTADFVAGGRSLRRLIRAIATSSEATLGF